MRKNKRIIKKGYQRLTKERRIQHIIKEACTLAIQFGYQHLTRDQIAERAGISKSLITHHFGSLDCLKKEILHAAIREGIPEIVAQGLIARDEIALKASKGLKEKASKLIKN